MKQTFVILLNFAFLNLFSQNTFVNKSTAYYNGKGEFENLTNNKATINEITLNQDSTYEMLMRPHVSCFTWNSFKGTWKKKGNEIIFTEKYNINESDTYEIYKNEKNDKYELIFESDKKIVLKNLHVKIEYEYDFYAKIKSEKPIIFVTDNNGRIEIPFDIIPSQNKLASLRFETEYNNRKIYGYLTENKTLNIKKTEIPTSIKIVIREEPKTEIITRTVKAIKEKDNLIILSTNKTKGKLTDYKKELKLEKTYTYEKQ